MFETNEEIMQLLADSKLGFINRQYDIALRLADEAIKMDSHSAEAYHCAGNVYLYTGRYEQAIRDYQNAVTYDPNCGDRYYHLGYACTTANKLADALKHFAKAEELGCTAENLIQLYYTLGIICFDIRRYDDALINFEKVEQVVGVDVDIMQRKAAVYAIRSDMSNGLLTANQMKLIAPSDYRGYQIAFRLLLHAKRFKEAQLELERAKKYAVPSMDFYFDSMTFELEQYQVDGNKEHLDAALLIIDQSLQIPKPDIKNVITRYINAADVLIQLEEPEKSIECLEAAQNPVNAYNNHFKVARITEGQDEHGQEELAAVIESNVGSKEFLTEIQEESQEKPVYQLLKNDKIEHTADNIDEINRLYIGAYKLMRNFSKVIEYARTLQNSENVQNTYLGKYAEASALKELGEPNADEKYKETIRFFRNAMILDPRDTLAVTFRIQCYIDVGDYQEAKEKCNLLTAKARETFLEKIKEAETGGASL